MALALAGLLGGASNARAQGTVHPVAAASAARDRGDFAGAVRILEAHLRSYPDDGDAARLLAQTLYWTGNVRASRRAYEEALRRHPGDASTRLQYAQLLSE